MVHFRVNQEKYALFRLSPRFRVSNRGGDIAMVDSLSETDTLEP
jgi:hypothetical protein